MKDIEIKLDNIFKVVFEKKSSSIKKANIKNTKKWDSLNHLNLIIALESTFKIKIPPDISMNLFSYIEINKFLKKIKINQ